MSIISLDHSRQTSIPSDLTTTNALVRHQNNFNLLRVVLAVSVIFSHSFPVMYGPVCLDPVAYFLRLQRDVPADHPIDLGHLALYGFFIISGYLVTMSWQNRRRSGFLLGLGDYGKKRFLRIYPGLLVNLLFCAFLVGPFAADNAHTYWHELGRMKTSYVLHTLLGQMTMPPVFNHMPVAYSVNAPLWTIMLEIRCYFMVAILGLAAALLGPRLPRRTLSAFPLTLFAVVYVVYVLCCSSHWAAVIGWLPVNPSSSLGHLLAKAAAFEGVIPRMVLYFLSGMCFYLYRAYVPYRWPLAAGAGNARDTSCFHLYCPGRGLHAADCRSLSVALYSLLSCWSPSGPIVDCFPISDEGFERIWEKH